MGAVRVWLKWLLPLLLLLWCGGVTAVMLGTNVLRVVMFFVMNGTKPGFITAGPKKQTMFT